MSSVSLPSDLSERGLKQFDNLKSRRQLFYEPSTPEYVEDNGFVFEFRISPVLLVKPILAPDDPGRQKASGPFSNPEPDFVVTPVGTPHLLQLGKFCMFRPSYILHPKKFAEQTTDLDKMDFEAAWAILTAFKAPQMILYNCGVEAGASQGHKHMQVLPRPSPSQFEMFPDKAALSLDEAVCLPHIPFVHWVIGLSEKATAEDVVQQHHKALAKARESLQTFTQSTAYNVLLVKEWLIVIPRVSKGRDGIGANGAGMMGLVWLRDEKEREGWTTFGLSKHLGYLGIPNPRQTD